MKGTNGYRLIVDTPLFRREPSLFIIDIKYLQSLRYGPRREGVFARRSRVTKSSHLAA